MIRKRITATMQQGYILKMPALLYLSFLLFTGVCVAYDPEASITGLYTGPYFDPLTPRNMTAHVGDEAKLPCTVRQLGDKSVSWVRVRDADILTVDRYTFVGDERFESHYSAATETWNLVIKYVQERDAGEYECQVSTEPKMSQLFSLRVVIPKVMIVPVGDRYVKAGSTVQVDCQITNVVQMPDYIFWYHEDKRVMDRLDPNLLVTVKQNDVEAMKSTLTIHKVRQEQSGNYTCMPSNLHAASVTLHVLNEKHPAGLQGERNGSCTLESRLSLCLALLVCVLVCTMSLGNDNEDTNQHKNKPTNTSNKCTSIHKCAPNHIPSHLVTRPDFSFPLFSRDFLPGTQFTDHDNQKVEILRQLLDINSPHFDENEKDELRQAVFQKGIRSSGVDVLRYLKKTQTELDGESLFLIYVVKPKDVVVEVNNEADDLKLNKTPIDITAEDLSPCLYADFISTSQKTQPASSMTQISSEQLCARLR